MHAFYSISNNTKHSQWWGTHHISRQLIQFSDTHRIESLFLSRTEHHLNSLPTTGRVLSCKAFQTPSNSSSLWTFFEYLQIASKSTLLWTIPSSSFLEARFLPLLLVKEQHGVLWTPTEWTWNFHVLNLNSLSDSSDGGIYLIEMDEVIDYCKGHIRD